MFVGCSDNNQLHFGAIVCMLGTRYKSYCSNIVRTLLVEPTAAMQANYDLLLRVEEEILNKLQHGTHHTCCRLCCRIGFCFIVYADCIGPQMSVLVVTWCSWTVMVFISLTESVIFGTIVKTEVLGPKYLDLCYGNENYE